MEEIADAANTIRNLADPDHNQPGFAQQSRGELNEVDLRRLPKADREEIQDLLDKNGADAQCDKTFHELPRTLGAAM